MKLNKTQISALANKFYGEIKGDIDKKNKEVRLKSIEKFRPDYNKGVELLKDNDFLSQIHIKISKDYSVHLNRKDTFESYTKAYNFNYILDKKIEIKLSDIEQNIILATIDAQSIEDIMKTLKSKYK